MKRLTPAFCTALLAVPVAVTSLFVPRQDEAEMKEQMAAAMAKARKYVAPGKHHEELKRFLGTWKTEMRIFMAGRPGQVESGESTFRWLMPGRWIVQEGTGNFIGRKQSFYSLMGYDNFRQSFVVTSVTSMDTAMNRSEGDMDPSGKSLLLYGTIDEYLTGEVGKMVKTVWRFESDDEMVMEVHDLAIGESDTKVIEVRYTRKG